MEAGVVAGDDGGLQVTLQTFSRKELMAEEHSKSPDAFNMRQIQGERGPRNVKGGKVSSTFPCSPLWSWHSPEVEVISGSSHSLLAIFLPLLILGVSLISFSFYRYESRGLDLPEFPEPVSSRARAYKVCLDPQPMCDIACKYKLDFHTGPLSMLLMYTKNTS
jgi:hypothetical protein